MTPQELKYSILHYAFCGKLSEQMAGEHVEGKCGFDIGEAPFDVPANWKWQHLGKCCEMYTGNSIAESEKKLKYELLLFVAAIIIIIIVAIAKKVDYSNDTVGPESKRAGRRGEAIATNAIKSVLRDGDRLFTNVEISFDNKPAELDNVIVNQYGVFIIEVKNYKGRLYGSEDDYYWEKYKDDGYGNTFEKSVKNPIKQVKRQTYILAKYLDYYGSHVWVDGYAFLIHGNSPIQSSYILSNSQEIDRTIHTLGRNRLSKQQTEAISKLLQ